MLNKNQKLATHNNPQMAQAADYIVNPKTGEILSPNDFMAGVALDMTDTTAPSLSDIRHPADRSLVKLLVKANKPLILV